MLMFRMVRDPVWLSSWNLSSNLLSSQVIIVFSLLLAIHLWYPDVHRIRSSLCSSVEVLGQNVTNSPSINKASFLTLKPVKHNIQFKLDIHCNFFSSWWNFIRSEFKRVCYQYCNVYLHDLEMACRGLVSLKLQIVCDLLCLFLNLSWLSEVEMILS